MALRTHVGCLALVGLVLCAATGCKDKGDKATAQGGAGGLDARCEKLSKACGDSDKHVEKLVDECKQAAKKQVDKGCADKAVAAYDCYETEVCGKADKVWALDDLRVLADRQKACVAERKALRECTAK
jgi:hypothetical protein